MGALLGANAVGLSGGAALAGSSVPTQTLMLGLTLTLLALALSWRWSTGEAQEVGPS